MENGETECKMEVDNSQLEMVKNKDFNSVKNALQNNIYEIQKKKMLDSHEFEDAQESLKEE